ncbi:hypothetical protein Prudu_021896 [Prunus dulcis]|uniref:Uncharacterized protein n=1 Tax=Prunus dulcis TaxID=3755 RepID=A0A4Y1RYC6_PRUDU|nr:hypothetical protein Prudu_021896 [Prunus dulcis]
MHHVNQSIAKSRTNKNPSKQFKHMIFNHSNKKTIQYLSSNQNGTSSDRIDQPRSAAKQDAREARDDIPPRVVPKRPLQIRGESRLFAPLLHGGLSDLELDHPLDEPQKVLAVGHGRVEVDPLDGLGLVMVATDSRARVLLHGLLDDLERGLKRPIHNPLDQLSGPELAQQLRDEGLDERHALVVSHGQDEAVQHLLARIGSSRNPSHEVFGFVFAQMRD